MKKLLVAICILLTAGMAKAQSLDDIRNLVLLGQFSKAKIEVDKFLAVEKNTQKAEAWYFKGKVYNSLSYDTSLTKGNLAKLNLKTQAFEAFKKAQSLEKKDELMKEENYISYLDLYYQFYDLGAKFFNAKDFENSFTSFKTSLDAHDYIISKGYTFKEGNVFKIDTALIMNVGAAALQAKRDADAFRYYNILVDAGIAGPDYFEIYQMLANYYIEKNDAAGLQSLLAKGRKAYPTSSEFNLMEIDLARKANDNKALFAKYDELVAAYPQDFTLLYNHAIELFNVLYAPAEKKVDLGGATIEKLDIALDKAIALDKGNDASVLKANHKYNQAAAMLDEINLIKGKTPADLKKKKDLEAAFKVKSDEAIVQAENAIKYFEGLSSMKTAQRNYYNQQLEHLAELYKIKGNAVKAAEYKKKVSY